MSAANDIAIAALSGGAAGAAVSLLTPWSQWGVEKRRARLEQRRQTVAGARAWCEDMLRYGEQVSLSDARFAAVQPYLSDELQAELAKMDRGPLSGRKYNLRQHPFVVKVSQDLVRLARKWDL